MNIPIKLIPESDSERMARLREPAFQQAPSPFHWGVLLHGGVSPRTGFEQPPLEFQFFAGHYTRKQIEVRAQDLCEREHRAGYIIREPLLSDGALLGLAKGHRKFAREHRRSIK